MEMATGFVKPYPQEALGGELGLTSEDIARALGVAHKELVRSLEQRSYLIELKQSGFLVVEISTTSILQRKFERRGLGKKFVCDIESAKAIVATSRTRTGAQYLRHLISCEAFVEQGLPKLEAEFRRLEAELVEAKAKLKSLEKPKRIPAQKSWRVVVGYRTVPMLGLNGEDFAKFPVIREIPLADMTDDERRIWESQHLSKISAGASAKSAQLLNGEIEPRKVTALRPLI